MSEGPNMSSGATRPGQPVMGQRSIFGGGKPVFAQMPSYTPVTREQPQPRQAKPAAPDYGGYVNPTPAPSYPAPHQSGAQAYPDPNGGAPQTHQSAGQAYPGQAYPPSMPQAYPAEAYRNEPHQAEAYPSAQPYPSAPYPAQNYGGQVQPSQAYQDASFPVGDETDANFADASFPETPDASFPTNANFPTNPAYGRDEPLELGGPGNGYGGEQARYGLNDQAASNYAPNYVGMPAQSAAPGQMGGRQIAPFDAGYDRPPQIALGGTEQAHRNAQGFYDGEQADADFLDEAHSPAAPQGQTSRKATLRSRSVFMVGSALLGAVALGGALAFAYKQSGGGMSSEHPPLVQADNRPVKEAPDDAGGKDLQHKNKLIYDRLQNGDQPETDHLVPRQEELALPSMPGSTETAALPADAGAPQTTQAFDASAGSAPAVASTDDPNAADDGGPRRVKTMLVRPDGSVMPPAAPGMQVATAEPAAAPSAAPAAPPVQAHLAAAVPSAPAAAAVPAPVASAPEQVAAIPPQAKPKPVKAAVVASADPAPQAAAAKTASQYVVQVGSKQNQTEALASFADMQQKYPTLLANYRPMVKKADLGTKGTWYRLQIGPINDKTVASKLCTQLKSQGMADCLVMAQ